jgi:hypothetical protein
MAWIIYGLCALTALLCCVLLFQAYRKNRYRLLLWSSFCFAGLTLSNVFVVIDELVIESIDFSTVRLVTTLVSLMVLLYGFIWDTE